MIGREGFGYERNEKGELEKFPHPGGVTIAIMCISGPTRA
jgi:UDP-3-O-[3-hydroxymyristoyl] glucosamine N-acyltransferase